MFYKVKAKDYIRVPPNMFTMPQQQAILQNVKSTYENFISKELGFVINVISAGNFKEGVIIPGDGAGYYETEFELLVYKPELNEVVWGKVRDITDFGAFVDLGATEGMVHISQSMDDFVSFSKEKVLQGKKSGHSLKVNDSCKARVIAISYKDMNRPKIGLTMRQEELGKLEWLENLQKEEKKEEKPNKEAKAKK